MGKRVVAFKEKGAKVLAALGGWNDSLGSKYSQMVATVASRARFIENAYTFIKQYGFDGLDLDWELYAKFNPSGQCNVGYQSPSQAVFYNAFLPQYQQYSPVVPVVYTYPWQYGQGLGK